MSGIIGHRGLLSASGGSGSARVLVMKSDQTPGTPANFVDRVGRTWTKTGENSSVAADPGGFGGSAILISGGAASNFYLSDSDASLRILEGGDFTVEAFIRISSASPGPSYGIPFIGYAVPTNDGWCFRCNTGALLWVYPNGGAFTYPVTWVPGKTYHVMTCREGSVHYMGIDGVVSTMGGSLNRTYDVSSSLAVGTSAFTDNVACNTYISPRITKGAALYTGSTYIVPTGPL